MRKGNRYSFNVSKYGIIYLPGHIILVEICRSAYRQNSFFSAFYNYLEFVSLLQAWSKCRSVGAMVVAVGEGASNWTQLVPLSPCLSFSLSAVQSIFWPLSSSQNSTVHYFGLTIPVLLILYLAPAGRRGLFVEVGCSFEMQVSLKACCVFCLYWCQEVIDLLSELWNTLVTEWCY